MKPIPPAILTRLRSMCLALPEAYEEQAWVGTRWCIRKKNFAPGWHENYSDYDLIFEFADGRFQEIYSRLGQR